MLAEMENKKRSNTGTLTVNGKTFVLVPASEYRALIRRASASDAQFPPNLSRRQTATMMPSPPCGR